MRAARIRIENIAGVEHLDIEPGKVTVIQGENEAGKSSVVNAILSVVEGGHEAKLLRKGTRKGETVIVFAENGRTLSARKTITAKGGELTLRDGAGVPLGQPQTLLKQLWNPISANPVKFVTGDKKERLRILLDAISAKMDRSRLREIVGNVVDRVPSEMPGLQAVEAVRKIVFDGRTETNRSLKEQRATIQAFEPDKPMEDPKQYEAALAEIQSRIEELRAEAARIDGLRTQALKWEKQKEVVERMTYAAEENEKASQSLTERLRQLDALKADMLEAVPIPGVEIRDGEIYVNDVAWDQLATSQRMKIAVQVAKLTAGEIKLAVIDGLEALDEKNMAAFEAAAAASDLCFIGTRVSNGALEVSTKG